MNSRPWIRPRAEIPRLRRNLETLRSNDRRLSGILRSVRSNDRRLSGILRSVRSNDRRLSGILRSVRSNDRRLSGILRSVRSNDRRLSGILRSVRSTDRTLPVSLGSRETGVGGFGLRLLPLLPHSSSHGALARARRPAGTPSPRPPSSTLYRWQGQGLRWRFCAFSFSASEQGVAGMRLLLGDRHGRLHSAARGERPVSAVRR